MKKVALLCVSLFLVACESKQEAQSLKFHSHT